MEEQYPLEETIELPFSELLLYLEWMGSVVELLDDVRNLYRLERLQPELVETSERVIAFVRSLDQSFADPLDQEGTEEQAKAEGLERPQHAGSGTSGTDVQGQSVVAKAAIRYEAASSYYCCILGNGHRYTLDSDRASATGSCRYKARMQNTTFRYPLPAGRC